MRRLDAAATRNAAFLASSGRSSGCIGSKRESATMPKAGERSRVGTNAVRKTLVRCSLGQVDEGW